MEIQEGDYFTSEDLAERWGCAPEAIEAAAQRGHIPAAENEGFDVERILIHEMKSPVSWPLCIRTLDTAKHIGLENEALDIYKALVFGSVFRWFFNTPDWEEAKDIYNIAIGVKENG